MRAFGCPPLKASSKPVHFVEELRHSLPRHPGVVAVVVAHVRARRIGVTFARRPEYPLNLSSEGFQRLRLLAVVLVLIVDAFNAFNSVPKDALGVIVVDTGARHQRAGCPARLVQLPLRQIVAGSS